MEFLFNFVNLTFKKGMCARHIHFCYGTEPGIVTDGISVTIVTEMLVFMILLSLSTDYTTTPPDELNEF